MPPQVTPAVIPQRYEPAVPLDQLVLHPANPNSGDVSLIAGSLDVLGFYGAVIAQESTGIVCAGNHRLLAARAKGMTTLPVVWADIDDDRRDRILLMDNESTRQGTWDEPTLVAFLQGLAPTPGGLDGTGFDGDRLDDMINRLNPPPPEGFPEYGEDIETTYRCPKCGYTASGDWSVKGQAKISTEDVSDTSG